MEHYSNYLLPDYQHTGIAEDERKSLAKIEGSLELLQSFLQTMHENDESIPVGLLEEATLWIRQHRTLRYYFSVSLTSTSCNLTDLSFV